MHSLLRSKQPRGEGPGHAASSPVLGRKRSSAQPSAEAAGGQGKPLAAVGSSVAKEAKLRQCASLLCQRQGAKKSLSSGRSRVTVSAVYDLLKKVERERCRAARKADGDTETAFVEAIKEVGALLKVADVPGIVRRMRLAPSKAAAMCFSPSHKHKEAAVTGSSAPRSPGPLLSVESFTAAEAEDAGSIAVAALGNAPGTASATTAKAPVWPLEVTSTTASHGVGTAVAGAEAEEPPASPIKALDFNDFDIEAAKASAKVKAQQWLSARLGRPIPSQQ